MQLSVKEKQVETYLRYNNQVLDTSDQEYFLGFPDGSLYLTQLSGNYYSGDLLYLGGSSNYRIKMDCYFAYYNDNSFYEH